MHGAEIELKFPVSNVAAFRRAVSELGFALVTERTFEANTLYDTPTRELRGHKQLLRLRQYGPRWIVTHKRQDESHDDSRYKMRIETESEVEDGEALAEIFTQLGYAPAFRYEKYRTEWADAVGHLVLDETPIGIWAEVEGPESWIDSMLEKLGVGIDDCSTLSYGKLFMEWKERTGSPAEHLTFDEVGVAVGV